MYKGFAVVAGFTIPAHALYFYGYETTKRLVMPNTPMEEKGAIVHFVAGLVADVFGAFIWVPQVLDPSTRLNCSNFLSVIGCRKTKIASTNQQPSQGNTSWRGPKISRKPALYKNNHTRGRIFCIVDGKNT